MSTALEIRAARSAMVLHYFWAALACLSAVEWATCVRANDAVLASATVIQIVACLHWSLAASKETQDVGP